MRLGKKGPSMHLCNRRWKLPAIYPATWKSDLTWRVKKSSPVGRFSLLRKQFRVHTYRVISKLLPFAQFSFLCWQCFESKKEKDECFWPCSTLIKLPSDLTRWWCFIGGGSVNSPKNTDIIFWLVLLLPDSFLILMVIVTAAALLVISMWEWEDKKLIGICQ